MSDSNSQLATVQEQQLSIAGNYLSMIERAAKDPAIDIDKMERLLAMAERMEERNAVQQFNSAFSAMQKDLPVIVAETVIPNRGKYARFEDVMRQIQPMLTSHGFAVSFNQDADEKRIKVTCNLHHIGGHSEANTFAVRLGGRADSDTQADCKASTTAKRNALLQALNIVIRQDVFQDEDEAHNEGGEITQQQADELRELCDEVNADRKKFLEYAGAAHFEAIPSCRLSELTEILNRKRK